MLPIKLSQFYFGVLAKIENFGMIMKPIIIIIYTTPASPSINSWVRINKSDKSSIVTSQQRIHCAALFFSYSFHRLVNRGRKRKMFGIILKFNTL